EFLVACENSNTSSKDDRETKPDSEKQEKNGNDEGEGEETNVSYYQTPEMDFDLGGKTIKVVSWWDMEMQPDNPDNIKKIENLEALKEKHNFDIEYVFIDYEEYQSKVVASLTAGEPIGDIVRLGKTYTVPTLVKQDF